MLNAEKVIKRRFVIEALPEPLQPSDDHLQIFENYVPGTRLRLRSVRRPLNDDRRWFFEQRESTGPGVTSVNRLHLDRTEYDAMRPLRGREIRKNRYEFRHEGAVLEIDVFLGDLWGLNLAAVRFAALADAEAFEPPSFCLLEVTDDPTFEGSSLVDLDFSAVRSVFAKAKGESL
ncbi:MAG: hypothetical protein J5I65_05675 [Aridibacter famidurans]|nr:hypothetical protein [Aridibacter famidurans]